MNQSERYLQFELWNNFLSLNIDWVEKLSINMDTTFSHQRNVVNFICQAPHDTESFIEEPETGRRWQQCTGDVLLVPIGTPVHYKIPPEVTFITLHFALEFMIGIDLFSCTKQIYRFHDSEAVTRMQTLLNHPDSCWSMLALRTEIMNLSMRCRPEMPGSAAAALENYSHCLAYFSPKVNAETTVEDLAEYMKCRREVLSRNFRRDVGITPTAWLHRMLTRRISTYLLIPDMTLQEIARKLHFSSEFYLSRFFKRLTGSAPRDYRKAIMRNSTVRKS